MCPKNFKGIVKISDVQTEFDNLILTINDAVDAYNNIEELQGIDYTKAGSTLAPLGYTLTVGGLKQFMQIYDGIAIGVRVFKTGNNQCKPTAGLLIAKDKFYRIPDEVVSGYGTMLFYDPKKHQCQIGGATKVFKDLTQPDIKSNNTWGSFSASMSSGSAWKSTKTLDLSNISSLNNVWDGIRFTTNTDNVNTLTWRFPSTIKLTNIGFTIYSAAYSPMARSFSVEIKSTSNNATLAKYDGRNGLTGDWNIPINNVNCNGIQILIKGAVNTASGGAWLGNLKIQGQVEQWQGSDEVGDGLYKIADLNWEKTSSDKLWLNDLPNTMY